MPPITFRRGPGAAAQPWPPPRSCSRPAVQARLVLALVQHSTQSASASNSKHLSIAYLSFAVENSYDAPMLAAARGRGQRQQRDAQGLRREQQPADAVLPAPGRHHLGSVPRHHPAADLRHRPDLPGPAGHRQGHQGREHGPGPRPELLDRRAPGRGPGRQRDVRADRDRHQARQHGGPGLPVQEPQPVQRRLPVRHQGVRAGRGDIRSVQQGDRGRPRA